jgi:hypothetical protein
VRRRLHVHVAPRGEDGIFGPVATLGYKANGAADVNSAAAETRPTLSWDGTTLYFGSTLPGGGSSTDHYVTTREKVRRTIDAV